MATRDKNSDPESAAFGAKLRAYRERARLTQKELAGQLSEVFADRGEFPDRRVLQSRVAKWEGAEARPYGWQFAALAAVSGLPVLYWMLSEVTDPADPRCADRSLPDRRDEATRLLMNLIQRYGAQTVLDRFTGAQPPAAPAPDPAPLALAPDPGRPPGTGPLPQRGKRYNRN